MHDNLFRGTRPTVLTDRPDHPGEGKIIVWAWTDWFERVEGPSGNITFDPIAGYETELYEWLNREGIHEELTEIEGDFANIVIGEFLEQSPLYPEAPEFSSQPPFEEQNPDEDTEHI